ncbi:MAG: hypothetical protein CMF50_03940 [Legionellales bacterium]|nr:hypothetical protein [Legionellales bacterium]|tara:strand:+ start:3506 stop:5467 length:1962 start_codon:yes stop_codon:yes gene_type:complete
MSYYAETVPLISQGDVTGTSKPVVPPESSKHLQIPTPEQPQRKSSSDSSDGDGVNYDSASSVGISGTEHDSSDAEGSPAGSSDSPRAVDIAPKHQHDFLSLINSDQSASSTANHFLTKNTEDTLKAVYGQMMRDLKRNAMIIDGKGFLECVRIFLEKQPEDISDEAVLRHLAEMQAAINAYDDVSSTAETKEEQLSKLREAFESIKVSPIAHRMMRAMLVEMIGENATETLSLYYNQGGILGLPEALRINAQNTRGVDPTVSTTQEIQKDRKSEIIITENNVLIVRASTAYRLHDDSDANVEAVIRFTHAEPEIVSFSTDNPQMIDEYRSFDFYARQLQELAFNKGLTDVCELIIQELKAINNENTYKDTNDVFGATIPIYPYQVLQELHEQLKTNLSFDPDSEFFVRLKQLDWAQSLSPYLQILNWQHKITQLRTPLSERMRSSSRFDHVNLADESSSDDLRQSIASESLRLLAQHQKYYQYRDNFEPAKKLTDEIAELLDAILNSATDETATARLKLLKSAVSVTATHLENPKNKTNQQNAHNLAKWCTDVEPDAYGYTSWQETLIKIGTSIFGVLATVAGVLGMGAAIVTAPITATLGTPLATLGLFAGSATLTTAGLVTLFGPGPVIDDKPQDERDVVRGALSYITPSP